MKPPRPKEYQDPVLFSIRELFPAMMKAQAFSKVEPLAMKDSFSGSAPAPFVGRHGYPSVNVGILSPPELDKRAWELDAPSHWASHDLPVAKIVEFRSRLVNSRFKADIRRPYATQESAGQPKKFLEVSQEVAMAVKPVDLEFRLKHKPYFKLNLSPEVAPTGPAGKLKQVEVASNPRIPKKIEDAVGDVDLKATGAMNRLAKKGVDENVLTRLLSVGTLGVKAQRRLVPTRWSITAVDDTLGKQHIMALKDYQLLGEHRLHVGEYLGNRFYVMLLPEVWGYELFETFLPTVDIIKSSDIRYTTDHESYRGRTKYAEHCAGGYYAARLPALEKLKAMRRQGRVIILRVISEGYSLPLGVWVVREAMRRAVNAPAQTFSSRQELLETVKKDVSREFRVDADYFFKRSVLLGEARHQRKLSDF